MVKDKHIRRIVGVNQLAREAKVSRTMIYNVARGLSTSARVAEILRRRGIRVEPRHRHSPRVEAALLQRGITPKNHTTNTETP